MRGVLTLSLYVLLSRPPATYSPPGREAALRPYLLLGSGAARVQAVAEDKARSSVVERKDDPSTQPPVTSNTWVWRGAGGAVTGVNKSSQNERGREEGGGKREA